MVNIALIFSNMRKMSILKPINTFFYRFTKKSAERNSDEPPMQYYWRNILRDPQVKTSNNSIVM